MSNLRYLFVFVLVLGLGTLFGHSDPAHASGASGQSQDTVQLEVYKDPKCGCCAKWIEHAQDGGFETKVHHPSNLNQLKADLDIARPYRACHTAISKEGYVFEGHIPAKFIRKFLKNPPKDAVGITVPGMPVGSPGMEAENRFSPYQIFLLKADGSTEVFAEVRRAQEQYR